MGIDLDALFAKLLDPVFVVDETGRIVFLSPACEKRGDTNLESGGRGDSRQTGR